MVALVGGQAEGMVALVGGQADGNGRPPRRGTSGRETGLVGLVGGQAEGSGRPRRGTSGREWSAWLGTDDLSSGRCRRPSVVALV